MVSRNARSIAMSTSVTRSMALFLSMRMSRPSEASCSSPARITASIAVARKTGAGPPPPGLRGADGSATRREVLDHAHFHASLGGPPEAHIVHEAAHEEDAATARFQQVLGRERVGDLLRVESFALIEHPDDELRGVRCRRERELDGHHLLVVLAVAVLDGVDHRLADRDPDPVDRVLVEAGHLAETVADDLDEVQHLEVTVDLQHHRPAACQHAGRARPALRKQKPGVRWTMESAGLQGTQLATFYIS